MNIRKDILWRVWFSIGAVALFGAAIVFQSFSIQYKEGDALRSYADSLTIFPRTIEAERGNIYSEDGSLLSTSLPYFEVRMDFQSEAMTNDIFNQHVDSLAYYLSLKIGTHSKEDYVKELIANRTSGNRYYLIKRNVTYPELQTIKQWPFFKLGRYKSGMVVIQKNKRVMPFGILAQRSIGYVRDEGRYKVGIEGRFDEILSGVEGQMLVQRVAGGVYIPLNERENIAPRPGYDIYMTIDINQQDIVESELHNALKEHDADHGCAILMEVKTGKIKAIANIGWNENTTRYEEIYNYAIGESTEPGSTFKLMSMAALLEDELVSLDEWVDVQKGEIKYADRVMRDAYAPKSDTMSVLDVFAKSSNVGLSKLITKYYQSDYQSFYDKLMSFKLAEPVGIEIVGEPFPTIYHPDEWSLVSLPWMSIGYEVKLTPLQTLQFYNTVANDGIMVKPFLVSSIREYDQVIKSYDPTIEDNRLLSKNTCTTLQMMMEEVVLSGTAKSIQLSNLMLAGKTGTSRIANATAQYSDRIYQASFVGYFPAENPMYSCIVVVNNPKNGKYYGGSVAAPIFSKIAQKVYANSIEMHEAINAVEGTIHKKLPDAGVVHYDDASTIYNDLGISFHADESAGYGHTQQVDNSISWKAKATATSNVPDVRDMDLSDALYVLENVGLVVSVQGHGKVFRQSLTPGAAFSKGDQIQIELAL